MGAPVWRGKPPRTGAHTSFLRFFFFSIYPTKKVERFPVCAAIQDTDEPSSDRLIQEGRPRMRRLSIFLIPGVHTAAFMGPSSNIPGFLHESGYCLRKHRIDMLVDSQR